MASHYIMLNTTLQHTYICMISESQHFFCIIWYWHDINWYFASWETSAKTISDGSHRGYPGETISWLRHQMETFSTLLALCVGNSPVTGEFPSQRPVMRSFEVSFDLRLKKRLSKQSWGWWFETPSRSLRRQCNVHCTTYEKCWHKSKIIVNKWSVTWLEWKIIWRVPL